ncbi:hypothetical protein [Pseudoalteromonas pernae]
MLLLPFAWLRRQKS